MAASRISFRSFAAIQTSVIGSSHSPKEKVVPLSATDIPDYPTRKLMKASMPAQL
jgi:hypothetical protein